jgi:hypothetical protein
MISGFITLLHTKRFHFKSLGLELLQAASSSELMTCMIYNTVSAAAAAAAVTAAGGWGFVLRFCQLEKPVYCHRLLVLSQFHLGTSRRWWVFRMYPPLMVMNLTQVHLSVVECYKQWFFSNKFSHFLRKNLGNVFSFLVYI